MRTCEICYQSKRESHFTKKGRGWAKTCLECVHYRRVCQYRDGKFNVVVGENIEFVADLIIVGTRKHEITRVIRLWLGPGPNGELITPETAEKLLSLARESLVRATALTRGEHQAIALDFYKSVLRNSKATIRDKLAAQKRMDKLLGLEIHDAPSAPPWQPRGAEYSRAMQDTIPADRIGGNGEDAEDFFSGRGSE